ncbi:MAG: MoxR family ATPase [Clostridiaceae bacterium]|nr:MoxR family ATPase [Clostridiaceae bacterium]
MNSQELIQAVRKNVAQILVGRHEAVDYLMIALLCEGHILIEDMPGVGKTTLAQAFAKSLDLSFQRIQFTPDVLPSDITGYNLYHLQSNAMEFHPGSIMSQIILADEINRSSPKTQSSLLEVMEERQVTVDGVTRPVPVPFMVLATQNPIEYAGTFPLPEAQLDRFLLRIRLGYPSHQEELAILQRHLHPPRWQELKPVISLADLLALQEQTRNVKVSQPVMEYIARIAAKTRDHDSILLGISPRGSIALMRAARARACLGNRDYVLPDDIQHLILPVFLHRLVLRPEAAINNQAAERLLLDLVRALPVPAVL